MEHIQSPTEIPDLLARSYMFCRTELIRQGAWQELVKNHIHKHYSGRELNSKRTNIHRSFDKLDSFSWETYYEALAVLAQVTTSLTLTINLATNAHIEQFTVPIKRDRTEWVKRKGVPIKVDNKNPEALFMPADQDRSNESVFTFIIREALRKQRITVKGLNEKLDAFIKDANNIATYSVDTPTNIKSSLKATLCRGTIAWPNVPRLLKLLGYTNITLVLEANTGLGARRVTAGLDL